MRRSFLYSLLAALTIFTDGSLAVPSQHSHEARQSPPRIVTTGPQGSGVQPRLEIHQLMADPDQWNLYILALRRYMDNGNDDAYGKSYYAIMGIHGVPALGWGGLKECDQCSKSNPVAYGYCTHASIQFPGWHRLYLALYEQILVENAVAIANQYPRESRARMVDAALKLRAPYSDWAALPDKSEGQNFPKVFSSPKINIEGPKGKVTVDNPLFSYRFANPNAGNAYTFVYFGSWFNTLRWPTTEKPNAVSQPQKAVDAMNALRGNLQEQIFSLLSNCPNYQSMSNSNGGSRQCANSLETIHNAIHSAVGGLGPMRSTGHMASLPFSAFEPFFMVHHCNVDRYFSFWQAVNPGVWGAQQPIGFSTWTYPVGAVQDSKSDMVPFFKDNSGKFYNLDDTRDWTKFGYTYPEFLATDGSKAAISSLVSALYGPNANLTAGSIPVPKPKAAPAPRPAPANNAPTRSPSRAAPSDPPADSPAQSQQVPNPPARPASANAPAPAPVPQDSSPSPSPTPPDNSPPTNSPPTNSPPTNSPPAPAPAPMAAPAGPANTTQPPDTGSAPSWLTPGTQIPGFTDWLNANGNGVGQIHGQYVANIVSSGNALGGRYTVYVFKDAPTEQADSLLHDSNLIGSVVMPTTSNTSAGYQAYGAVPLSFFLQRQVAEGQLPSTEDTVVLPWLKEHLQWRIVGPDGELVSPDKVDGFAIAIYSSRSQILSPAGLPHWEPVQPQLDVTKDSPGGASQEPDFVARITHGLLGQPGGGSDSIGSEIAQVVGATMKNVNNAVSGMAQALSGAPQPPHL